VAFDLSGLASATPWGAAASALSGALSTPTSSSSGAAPLQSGPKVINVAGFGSDARGSASQSLTAAEPYRGDWFPSTPSDWPPWVLPAAGVLLVLGVVGVVLWRK
jgi:hypothetical protein